jgi:methionyl-tRNA synthetase
MVSEHAVLAEIWAVVAEANRYFAGQEPWALRKTDPARMASIRAGSVLRRAQGSWPAK